MTNGYNQSVRVYLAAIKGHIRTVIEDQFALGAEADISDITGVFTIGMAPLPSITGMQRTMSNITVSQPDVPDRDKIILLIHRSQ